MNLTTTSPPPLRSAFADRSGAGSPLVHGQEAVTMSRQWLQWFLAIQNPVSSSSDHLTANAGGGQAHANPMPSSITRFRTVANAGDSALLPPSFAGAVLFAINSGAHAMNVYPSGQDSVNALGPANPYSLAAGNQAVFICANVGNWFAIQGS